MNPVFKKFKYPFLLFSMNIEDMDCDGDAGPMIQQKKFDLEARTLAFAANVRKFVKLLPKTQGNYGDTKQLLRSSGSVGANYIEANEALGRGDFLMRLRISRKESKESLFWLRLVDVGTVGETGLLHEQLCKEAQEFVLIFSSIIRNTLARDQKDA